MTGTASEADVLKAERRSLHTYAATMIFLAVLGFAIYGITQVSATQLDGVISLINAGAAFIAARLALASTKPADPENPYGRMALENFYGLFRSLMILGVVIIAVVTNTIKVIDYLITRNGHEPEFGLAAVYTAAVAVICFGLKWNHERNNRRVNGASALLRVEATAAKMEGLISAGICGSLILVAVVPEGTVLTSANFNIKDIADSIIVLVLCEPAAYVERYAASDKANSGLGQGVEVWPVPYWFGDAAFVAMGLLLGAAAHDLGAAFLGAFRGVDAIKEAFAIPPTWELFATVLLGHPDGGDHRSASLDRTVPRSSRLHFGGFSARSA